MNQEILDYQLLRYLHNEISKLPLSQQIQLKTLSMCGRKVIKPQNGTSGVFVLTNGNRAKFFGNTMCKNPFACPCCSAHRMAIYSAQIGLALDEMRKRGYIGFMVTFTIPHLCFMSCRETTDLLYQTYSYYRRTMKQKIYERRVNGELKNRKGTISHQFYEEIKIEHSVTVCEYTHGKNGWHPHFHAIYWTKRENADKVLEWEKRLSEFWLATAKRITLNHWQKNELHFATDQQRERCIEKLYSRCEKNAGIFFSKTNGKISESFASQYICGWGADREVTGNYRKMASNEGHRTPYQILESAYNGNIDDRDLYIDYCLAVTLKPVHHRVIWSQTGIKKIVLAAEQVNKCREIIKKKEEHWEVLCWFDRQQWSYVNSHSSPLQANILYLASQHKEILLEFLDGLGVEYHLPAEHYYTPLIEEIYNSA